MPTLSPDILALVASAFIQSCSKICVYCLTSIKPLVDSSGDNNVLRSYLQAGPEPNCVHSPSTCRKHCLQIQSRPICKEEMTQWAKDHLEPTTRTILLCDPNALTWYKHAKALCYLQLLSKNLTIAADASLPQCTFRWIRMLGLYYRLEGERQQRRMKQRRI